MDKKDIRGLTIEEFKKDLRQKLFPSYRAEQIFNWVYDKGVFDFSGMNNLPFDLRKRLDNIYYIAPMELKTHVKSMDGTEKFLFELPDKNFIETVFIPGRGRKTLCISTQVGCRHKCAFCMSGMKGFKRNLSMPEITGQALFARNYLKCRITNIVFMGMGEPLDNYDNLAKAIVIMNHPKALGIGARKMTVSTCGIVPGIEKLKNLEIQVNLSVSLHAANNKLRDILVPVNKKYPLETLCMACEDFTASTGRKITLEYVLIKRKNDSLQDAKALAEIAKRLKAKVNLIPYSVISDKNFIPPSKKEVDIFKNMLLNSNLNVTVRESKGSDIQAACGQLAGYSLTCSNAQSGLKKVL